MCGRFIVFSEKENYEMMMILQEVKRRYAEKRLLDRFHEGELCPTDVAPILVGTADGPSAQLLPWGYPRWDGKSGVIINARAETAAEKPMFRRSIAHQRCIIPTCGFFEWRHEAGKATKAKYLFTMPGASVLYLAGLYSEFHRPDEPATSSFVILTTQANASVQDYHDRMPLVVDPQDLKAWLTDEQFARDLLLRPCTHRLTASAA